ncbi:hypothetical protein MLD38_008608 [Melastoma candidum]|uniref:Uncharacterized protein n=1 Tax=Melastoma candidum TaxID=119954 RepID=A0ACB9S3D7_9MYRT|nr:hypothetical protein MLD38_008608 [Melastoma candidum]
MPIEVEEVRSFVVAMKGHGCTGKSSLAWHLARLLGRGCVLLSNDDVAACAPEMLLSENHDDLCHQILCRLAATEILAKSASYPCVVIDCALPKRHHLDQVLKLREVIQSPDDDFTRSLPVKKNATAAVFVVECRPRNKSEWRRRFESGASGATSSTLPCRNNGSTWKEMQRKVIEQDDYVINDVPHLVVDTTHPRKTVEDLATDVLQWMLSSFAYTVESADSPQSFEEFAGEWLASTLLESLQGKPIRDDDDDDEDEGTKSNDDEGDDNNAEEKSLEHHLHDHPLLLCENLTGETIDVDLRCKLCSEAVHASFYGCSECQFYLHKSCAKLPERIEVPFHEHNGCVLYIADKYPSNEEKIHGRECVLCDDSSGVLYKCHTCSVKIHQECTRLPRSLIHPCHNEHPLNLRIEDVNSFRRYQFFCYACGFEGHDAFYFCKHCNYHCHVKCALYLERSVLHKRHWDPLILSPPPKDETDEYYCEICAERRHPDVWIYLCSKCDYQGHVSCVNPDVPQCPWEGGVPESRWQKKMYVKREHGPPLKEIPPEKSAWTLISSREGRRHPSQIMMEAINNAQIMKEAINNGCVVM